LNDLYYNIERRLAVRRILFLGAFGALLSVSSGFALPLCTSFSVPASGGTFVQSGNVCDVGDLVLSDLQFIWDNTSANPDPGLISINIDNSVPGAPALVITSANKWFARSNTEVDFTLIYTLTTTPGGNMIIGGNISAVADIGWDPGTNPGTGGFTGGIAGSDNFAPAVGPGGLSQVNMMPSAPDGICPPAIEGTPCHVTQSGTPTIFSKQNSFKTSKDMLILGGDHALDIGQLDSVTQIIYENVPEPGSTVLVGAGLIAVALAIKKRLPGENR
jgi:hypothetical protein